VLPRLVRGSFLVFRDVLQRSEYAGFDQGNLIRNQAGGGVHSACSILDVVQAADGSGEQAAGLFLVHGTSSVFGIALRAPTANRLTKARPGDGDGDGDDGGHERGRHQQL
jgi:hypothetical protein